MSNTPNPDLIPQTPEIGTDSILESVEEITTILKNNDENTEKQSVFSMAKPLSEEDSQRIQNLIPVVANGLKNTETAVACAKLISKLIIQRTLSESYVEEPKITELCINTCAQIADQVLVTGFENLEINSACEIVALYSQIYSLLTKEKLATYIESPNIKLINKGLPNLAPFVNKLIELGDTVPKKTLRLVITTLLEFEDFQNVTKEVENLLAAQISLGNFEVIRIVTGFLTTFENNRLILRRLMDVIREGIEKKFGIDAYRFIAEWERTYGIDEFDRRNVIQSHLNRMFELEDKYKGSVKFMFEEYGIVNFGRYSSKMLIQQYEQREILEDGHTILIYPRTDHNGAFNRNPVGEELSFSLGLNVKIYECDGIPEMNSLLSKNEKRHGKIGIAILGGHGSQNSISLGHFGQESELTTGHIVTEVDGQTVPTEFGKSLASRFLPNGSIFLESCSTASGTGGIARALSMLGLKVIGPTAPASVYELRPKKINGDIRFYPTYVNESRLIIAHKVFKNGIDITEQEEVWE